MNELTFDPINLIFLMCRVKSYGSFVEVKILGNGSCSISDFMVFISQVAIITVDICEFLPIFVDKVKGLLGSFYNVDQKQTGGATFRLRLGTVNQSIKPP